MWIDDDIITAKIVFYGSEDTVKKYLVRVYEAFSGKKAAIDQPSPGVLSFQADALRIEDKLLRLLVMGTPEHEAGRLVMLKGTDIVILCWSDKDHPEKNLKMVSELCVNLETLGLTNAPTKLKVLYEGTSSSTKPEPKSAIVEIISHHLKQYNRTLTSPEAFDLKDPMRIYQEIIHSMQSSYEAY